MHLLLRALGLLPCALRLLARLYDAHSCGFRSLAHTFLRLCLALCFGLSLLLDGDILLHLLGHLLSLRLSRHILVCGAGEQVVFAAHLDTTQRTSFCGLV